MLKKHIYGYDVTIQPSYKGNILQSNGDYLLYNLDKSFNKIILLSEYHLHNNLNYIKLPINKYHIIPNMIDISYYQDNIPIIKNRFIYTSDVSRGLDLLLDCLIYLQNKLPDISLVVFRKNEFTHSIINKLNKLNNVIVYGKENQKTIASQYLQAEYFFYPTHFHETFCNAAAEAQLLKQFAFIIILDL